MSPGVRRGHRRPLSPVSFGSALLLRACRFLVLSRTGRVHTLAPVWTQKVRVPLCVPLWPAFDLGGRACLSHSHRSCGKTLCLGASAAPTHCPPAQPSPSSCPAGWPSSLPVPGGQARGFQGDPLLPWPRARREPGAGLPHGGGVPSAQSPITGLQGRGGTGEPRRLPFVSGTKEA